MAFKVPISCIADVDQDCPGMYSLHIHAAFGVGCRAPIKISVGPVPADIRTGQALNGATFQPICPGFGYGHLHAPGARCCTRSPLSSPPAGNFRNVSWPESTKSLDAALEFVTKYSTESPDALKKGFPRRHDESGCEPVQPHVKLRPATAAAALNGADVPVAGKKHSAE